MKEKFVSIAIDGPSGAGKSTMAKCLAKELGYVYLDTGAIYRTVAYHLSLMGISPKDTDGVRRLIDDVKVEVAYEEDGTQRMILNGRDVTDELRTPEISKNASLASAQKPVRDYLLGVQRNLAKQHNIIMDGRDIGTVVLPKANVKVFLTASPEVRARRRYEELIAKGQNVAYGQVLADMKMRDAQDTGRAIAPLAQAKDAVRLDTSELSLEESVAALRRIVEERLKR